MAALDACPGAAILAPWSFFVSATIMRQKPSSIKLRSLDHKPRTFSKPTTAFVIYSKEIGFN
jgi:hypothetical protein